jgi:benzoylsuccinyl-CoA thiolase BbsA subunit
MTAETSAPKRKYIDDRWFRESDGKLSLVGTRCGKCRKVFFPAKEVCPDCFDGELAVEPLSMRGRLHTFSRSDMGVDGIEVPYVFGFLDLPENIKLFGMITDCDPWDEVLKIGMEMEVYIAPVRRDGKGNELVAYKFRPLRGGR